MTPCVMYTRVSSDEQAKAGYSIPYQRQRIHDYARLHQLDIRDRFEEAHSAKRTGRPGFERMLAYVREHPEVRTILVHKQDRIARNLTDWAHLKERLKVHVIAVDEPVADTPMGWLTQTFGAAMATWYSDNLSLEVRKGLRGKFEHGGCVARAPAGYRNIPRTRTEKARVVIDEVTAPLVRAMFDRYATGAYSFAVLADEMADLGLRTKSGKPFPKDRIRKLLRNPFYKGCVTYLGDVRPGGHEALVPEPLWADVQDTLALRHTDTGDKGSRFFLLRGLLWCGTCGRRFTGEVHPRGSYYRCMPDARRERCSERLVPVPGLDAAVEARLLGVVLREGPRAEVLDALTRIGEVQDAARIGEEQGLRVQKERLDAKLMRLASAYAEGVMPREQYTVLRTQTEAELRGVVERLDVLTRDLGASIAAVRRLLDRTTAFPDLYRAASTPEDRKALLREIFARIEVKNRAITRIEYNPPFELLLGDPRPSDGSRCDLAHALLDRISGTGLS